MAVRRTLTQPLVLLALLSALSLGARIAWLGSPCHSPCTRSTDHLLVFDEAYYVNAARVIAGIAPPAGAHYAGTPFGDDPNSEHPQLVKLVTAGAIELFGDGPLAWRIGSLLAGSLAILGMFALARAAGGGPWLSLGAAALMAADNLMLVHGRIGTLDIYVVAAMIWALALYLRGRPLLGGVVLGVGVACKLVAPYALLVVALLEVARAVSSPWLRSPRAAAARLLSFTGAMAATFIGLLAAMDRVARPYNPGTHRLVGGGPFGHLGHMISYAAGQTSPHGPRGIASYPWQWLGDFKPIVYLSIDPSRPERGFAHDHPSTFFLGMVSPPIMAFAVPALIAAAVALWRRAEAEDPAVVGLAWVTGTFLPFETLSLFWSRTSYLYYMVIVLPGIYLVVASLAALVAARAGPGRKLVIAFAAAVGAAAIVMYPFNPIL